MLKKRWLGFVFFANTLLMFYLANEYSQFRTLYLIGGCISLVLSILLFIVKNQKKVLGVIFLLFSPVSLILAFMEDEIVWKFIFNTLLFVFIGLMLLLTDKEDADKNI